MISLSSVFWNLIAEDIFRSWVKIQNEGSNFVLGRVGDNMLTTSLQDIDDGLIGCASDVLAGV